MHVISLCRRSTEALAWDSGGRHRPGANVLRTVNTAQEKNTTTLDSSSSSQEIFSVYKVDLHIWLLHSKHTVVL